MSRFEGRVVAITGASMGIGAAAAELICAEGGRVVGVARREGPAQEVTDRLGPDRIQFVLGDVSEPETASRAVAACEELGGPAALINNAAVDHAADLLATPPEDARRVLEVNFFGALWMLQAFAASMKGRGGGAIVNISSRLASIGVPTMGIYGASKGALEALGRNAAIELASSGVRVNAVAPGFTATPLFEEYLEQQEDADALRERLRAQIPQGRFATPEDVAAAAAFLASDEAAHITGATLPVDGGYTAA